MGCLSTQLPMARAAGSQVRRARRREKSSGIGVQSRVFDVGPRILSILSAADGPDAGSAALAVRLDPACARHDPALHDFPSKFNPTALSIWYLPHTPTHAAASRGETDARSSNGTASFTQFILGQRGRAKPSDPQ